jgi:putative RecB family exonuclease
MTIYSYSRINTYHTCPYKYKLQYIDKIKLEEEGIEAFMGSRVHETLEKLYSDLKEDKENTIEQLIGYYNRIWSENWHDKVVIVKDEFSAEDYRRFGENAIRGYYEQYYPFDQTKILWIEEKRFFNLNDDQHKMLGIIDRLDEREDGTLEIHDYKTSGRLPSQQQIDIDKQLALYQLAVSEAYPEKDKIELVWHFVRFDIEFRSERSKEQLMALRNEYSQYIDELETVKRFTPNESPLCNWCGYQEYCPAKRGFVCLDDF